jgi:O-ureido-D-serine cyclo-ligase
LKPVIALVSARRARGLDEDEAPLVSALRSAGARVDVTDWDDPSVDWASYDEAVLRSTWDYTERPGDFLAWAERVAGLTRLSNPAPVVRWNTDKHYLGELARAGIPAVPSTFVEPGEDAATAVGQFVSGLRHAEIVVKPAVGAGSRDAQRYESANRDAAAAHTGKLLEAGRSVLLQPYLDRVEEEGETALIFFAGRFDHAIRKGPMLAGPRDAQSPPAGSPALFVSERITARTPQADELAVAARVLAGVPEATGHRQDLLYARVDLIRDEAGSPVLLELELTEPSLFFAQAPGSAARFARAILDRTRSFTL